MTSSSKAALLFVVIVSVAIATAVERSKRRGRLLGTWLGSPLAAIYSDKRNYMRGSSWPAPPSSVYDGKRDGS